MHLQTGKLAVYANQAEGNIFGNISNLYSAPMWKRILVWRVVLRGLQNSVACNAT
jgi:hypothetical protein